MDDSFVIGFRELTKEDQEKTTITNRGMQKDRRKLIRVYVDSKLNRYHPTPTYFYVLMGDVLKYIPSKLLLRKKLTGNIFNANGFLNVEWLSSDLVEIGRYWV